MPTDDFNCIRAETLHCLSSPKDTPISSPKLSGGDRGIRTPDPCDANAVLSQLSYIPRFNSSNTPGCGQCGRSDEVRMVVWHTGGLRRRGAVFCAIVSPGPAPGAATKFALLFPHVILNEAKRSEESRFPVPPLRACPDLAGFLRNLPLRIRGARGVTNVVRGSSLVPEVLLSGQEGLGSYEYGAGLLPAVRLRQASDFGRRASGSVCPSSFDVWIMVFWKLRVPPGPPPGPATKFALLFPHVILNEATRSEESRFPVPPPRACPELAERIRGARGVTKTWY